MIITSIKGSPVVIIGDVFRAQKQTRLYSRTGKSFALASIGIESANTKNTDLTINFVEGVSTLITLKFKKAAKEHLSLYLVTLPIRQNWYEAPSYAKVVF